MSEMRWSVGQKVILHYGASYAPRERVATISKITPGGAIRVDGSDAMFAAATGWQKGGQGYHRQRISPATEDALKRIAYRRMRDRVSEKAEKLARSSSGMEWAGGRSLSPETMQELERVLDEALAALNPPS